MDATRFYNRKKYPKDISLFGSEDKNFDGKIDERDESRDVDRDKSGISHYDIDRDGDVDAYDRGEDFER